MGNKPRLGEYEHYKGNRYAVLGVAKHSETLEDLVVYQDVSDPEKMWVRPLKMFMEDVIINGVKKPRFTFVK